MNPIRARTASQSREGEAAAARRPRILVMDDGGGIAASLRAPDPVAHELEIIDAGTGGQKTMQLIRSLAPDLVVADFRSASVSDAERLIVELKGCVEHTAVLVFTARRDARLLDAALRAGADGYVLRDDGIIELHSAVWSLFQGRRYVSSTMARHLIDAYVESLSRRYDETAAGMLTRREREVIGLIAAGYRNREIAEKLSLSHKTVEKHRGSLMRKLNLRTTAAVTSYAIANGYMNAGAGGRAPPRE